MRATEMGGFYRPPEFYLEILTKYEFAIFLLGIGGILCVFRLNNKFTRFLGIWTLLTIIIYIYLPYKLPNLIINILLPLSLCVGIFIDYLCSIPKVFKLLASLAILLLFSLSLYISLDTNFINYASESNPLVFVQTVDDVKNLLELVKEISYKKTGGTKIDMVVSVSHGEYPLSWYWRDYPNVKYLSDKVELPNNWTGIRWSGDGAIVWISDPVEGGKTSGKISSENGMDGEWRQKISVEGGFVYKLGVWIKTEKIEVINANKYAQCYVRTDLNGKPNEIIGETEPVIGTNDWTYRETEFYVNEKENIIWLTCTIGNWGWTKGSIWFTNISITREDGSYNFVQNPNFENGKKLKELLGPSIVIISESDGQILQPVKDYVLKKYTLRPGVVLAVYIKNDLF
ncbi:MAG: hypothetical protein QXJ14_02115 [Candidatus Aenigmatarchaeota archaeon]